MEVMPHQVLLGQRVEDGGSVEGGQVEQVGEDAAVAGGQAQREQADAVSLRVQPGRLQVERHGVGLAQRREDGGQSLRAVDEQVSVRGQVAGGFALPRRRFSSRSSSCRAAAS